MSCNKTKSAAGGETSTRMRGETGEVGAAGETRATALK